MNARSLSLSSDDNNRRVQATTTASLLGMPNRKRFVGDRRLLPRLFVVGACRAVGRHFALSLSAPATRCCCVRIDTCVGGATTAALLLLLAAGQRFRLLSNIYWRGRQFMRHALASRKQLCCCKRLAGAATDDVVVHTRLGVSGRLAMRRPAGRPTRSASLGAVTHSERFEK